MNGARAGNFEWIIITTGQAPTITNNNNNKIVDNYPEIFDLSSDKELIASTNNGFPAFFQHFQYDVPLLNGAHPLGPMPDCRWIWPRVGF